MSTAKNAIKFICESCDFNCSKQSNYDSHLLTGKHLRYVNVTNGINISPKNAADANTCECGKKYTHYSGLWRHKKTCNFMPIKAEPAAQANNTNQMIELLIKENSDFKGIIVELVRSNADLQKQMMEVCKSIQPSNITTNNSNSHNKTTFNMQVFLNETCKDAMNMKEFVDSIKPTLSDLEMVV